ncbi:CoA-binding protein [Gemmatimonadota bacterium]
MTTKAAVEDFVSQRTLAVVGVSSGGKKFGNAACRDLRAKGYRIIPVHPTAESINGERCYRSLSELPEPVGGVLVVVPPAETEKVVREAAAAGIKRIWMQQGAQSAAAIQFCQDQGLSVIHNECILMFAEPVRGGHRFHRFIWRVLGKLPG